MFQENNHTQPDIHMVAQSFNDSLFMAKQEEAVA